MKFPQTYIVIIDLTGESPRVKSIRDESGNTDVNVSSALGKMLESRVDSFSLSDELGRENFEYKKTFEAGMCGVSRKSPSATLTLKYTRQD